MKKKTGIILAVIAAVIIALGATIGYFAIPVSAEKEIEHMAVETGDGTFKVGIMSDSQLGQEEVFQTYLEGALNFFKAQGVNMILNVGDYTDTALKENYAGYSSAFDKIYGADKPITQSVMGNHDYWLPNFVDCWQIPFKGTLQRRFMEATGETSPWTHKVVNGYHFIGASPTNGGMGEEAYSQKLEWIKEQIEIAVKDDPNKPVFVLTHNNPQDTVYMSDGDGCKNLNELFSAYPQVVSISGHSHASLMDERSIYQKDYTAISTQCLSYVCFASGDDDVVQEDEEFIDEVPMAMIMTVTHESVTFDRYDTLTGQQAGDSWILPMPVSKDSFSYTDEIRSAAAVAPTWPEDFAYEASVLTQETDPQKRLGSLSFTAATHPQAVLYYEVTFTDVNGKTVEFHPDKDDKTKVKTTLHFMSDYAKAPEKRSETAVFTIPEKFMADLPAGQYTVSVTPTSAFSEPGETKTLEITLS